MYKTLHHDLNIRRTTKDVWPTDPYVTHCLEFIIHLQINKENKKKKGIPGKNIQIFLMFSCCFFHHKKLSALKLNDMCHNKMKIKEK